MVARKICRAALISIALLSTVEIATAQDQPSDTGFKFVLGTGLTYGGDTLATVFYTSGTTSDIRAGSLIDFHAGIEYRADSYALQATVGYHFDRAGATNGSVTSSRVPIEALAYYRVSDQFRIGAGVRKSNSVELDGNGVASALGTTDFDSKVGGILELEYLFSPKAGLKFRYVQEEFKALNIETDGSHFGVLINAYF